MPIAGENVVDLLRQSANTWPKAQGRLRRYIDMAIKGQTYAKRLHWVGYQCKRKDCGHITVPKTRGGEVPRCEACGFWDMEEVDQSVYSPDLVRGGKRDAQSTVDYVTDLRKWVVSSHPERWWNILVLRTSGETVTDVAVKLHCSRKTVWEVMETLGDEYGA